MFFIGGFNSVIPYVVYLSLIWTFVILSFGGRIAALLHKPQDKGIASGQVIYKSGDDNLQHCYHYASADQPQSEATASVPDLSQLFSPPALSNHTKIRYDSPPLPSAESFSFRLRGPPPSC
jgi:hypothetical protein